MHITKSKKPRWKGYILWFHYLTYCKRSNYRDKGKKQTKKTQCWPKEWERMNRHSRGYSGVNMPYLILQWQIYVIMCLFKPTECTKPRMNHKVNMDFGWFDYGVTIVQWCTMYTVPHTDSTNQGSYTAIVLTAFIRKKSTYKWSCTVKTHIVHVNVITIVVYILKVIQTKEKILTQFWFGYCENSDVIPKI